MNGVRFADGNGISNSKYLIGNQLLGNRIIFYGVAVLYQKCIRFNIIHPFCYDKCAVAEIHNAVKRQGVEQQYRVAEIFFPPVGHMVPPIFPFCPFI